MSVYTKRAREIFAPEDQAGKLRPVDNGDAQVWGTEIERNIDGIEAGVDSKIEDERNDREAALAAETEAREQAVDALQSDVDDIRQIAETGLKPMLDPVRLLVTTNVNLATDAEDGDTLDGETLVAGDRIGKAYNDAAGHSTNGVWIVQASGAAVRAADADTSSELIGARFEVAEGTHAGEVWGVRNTDAITIGTTAIVLGKMLSANPTSAEVIAARGGEPSLADAMDLKADVAPTDLAAEVVMDGRGRVLRATTSEGGMRTALFEIASLSDDALAFIDGRGRGFRLGAASGGSASAVSGFTEAEVRALDAWALGRSAAIRANGNPMLAALSWYYTWVIEYGQSLSVGALGHPQKTTSALYSTLHMLGDSVRSRDAADVFSPYGGSAVLKPLVGTVTNGTSVLDAAQVEALAWTATNSGETISVSFAGMVKHLWNQSRRSADDDQDRHIIVTSTGYGGMSIDQLDSGDYWNRTFDAANKLAAIAATSSKSIGAGVVLWAQGEQDYNLGTDPELYKSKFRSMWEDLRANCLAAEFAQTLKPMILTYQTSGSWVAGADLTISQAQLDLAREDSDVVMYGPSYPVTNKPDGHLDANGYRWLGCQAAKVYGITGIRGEGWQPLHCLKAIHRDDEMLLAMHVPAPPLVFRECYVGFTPMSFAQKGIRVLDDGGEVAAVSIGISDGGSVIKVKLARPTFGVVSVTFGDKAVHGGNTNIADSDATVAIYDYVYDPAAGDDPSANVAALIDKPYPLWNWGGAPENIIPASIKDIVMAGIAFIAKQASFDDAAEVFPPVTNGLQGWFYPRGNIDRAGINYVYGARAGVIVGSPVVHGGYMECRGAAYLQTDIPVTPAFTWLVAAASNDTLADAAHRPSLIGNYDSASGSSIWLQSALVAGNVFAPANQSRTLAVDDVAQFRLYALQVQDSITLKNLTAGTSATTALSGSHVVSAKKISIGASVGSAFSGKSKIAHASIYNRVLTPTELADLYAFIKFDLAFEGVTI